MKLSEYFVQLVLILNLKLMGLLNPKYAERAKRMLFLTSLAVTLAREGIIKKNTLDSLNEDMSVVNNSNALFIGEELGKSIWSNIDLMSKLEKVKQTSGLATTQEVEEICDSISCRTPKWISYNRELMKSDLEVLLASRVA